MRSKRSKPGMVREPVMVYLDAPDRDLLALMVDRTGLPKTELFRRGLRRLADETLTEKKPGWSLDVLLSNTDVDDGFPPDVAERHDYYLAGGYEEFLKKQEKRKRRARPR